MTVSTPPVFLQDGSHTAEEVRQMMANLFGCNTASFAGGVTAIDPGHGIVRFGSSELAVTENGTPNMSVNVAGGGAFIRGTSAAAQGVYSFYNDGTVNLSIDAADPTNARKDLIVCQVRDSAYAGSDDDARLFVVKGTAAGSPADPTMPANSLILARVNVAAGATSITTSDIDDLRQPARPWNTAWGIVDLKSKTSSQTFTATVGDVSGLSSTFYGILGRRYRVTAWMRAGGSSTTGGNAELLLTNGSNTQLSIARYGEVGATGDRWTFDITFFVSPGASGSITYKLRGRDATSAKNWQLIADTDNPAYLAIEDVGPAF